MRYFFHMLVTIFLVEAAVMVLLPLVVPAGFPNWGIALVDAAALTLGAAPLLWLLLFRPLHRAALREHAINGSIVEAAPDGILTIDERGIIQSFNAAAETIFGYTADEAIGQNVSVLMPSPYCQEHDEHIRRYLRTGESSIFGVCRELPACRKDGSTFPTELSVGEARSEDRRFFTGIVRDATDRTRNRTRLEDALQASQAAAEAKSEFLANMSHEIRTPLTAILGYIDLLSDGCPCNCDFSKHEFREYVSTVSRNAQHLLAIIDDILDISKIEAGKLTVERIPVSPCKLIAEVYSLANVRAQARGLGFEVEYDGVIPETIQSDPTRLRQVLLNLVSNAVKFTEQGSVRLVMRFRDAGGDSRLEFDVVDTGVGMTEEQAAALFQPFVQADTSTTRKFGGTGLGLAISKRLIELLGGEISIVETKPGVGTRFRVAVGTGSLEGVKMIEEPGDATVLEAEPTDSMSSGDELSLPACRILLAEDGPDNQRLIAYLLKKAGAEVAVVENGRLATDEALAARDAGHPFDVILMDMQMPVMDGYAATGLLRKKGYTGPIIALTAHTMAQDRQKCLDAGCDDYASKPVDRTGLIQVITQRLGADAAAADRRQPAECPSCQSDPVSRYT